MRECQEQEAACVRVASLDFLHAAGLALPPRVIILCDVDHRLMRADGGAEPCGLKFFENAASLFHRIITSAMEPPVARKISDRATPKRQLIFF